MEEPTETIIDVRKSSLFPYLVETHPSEMAIFPRIPSSSIQLPSPSFFSNTTSSEPRKSPVNVKFTGCLNPLKNWNTWVDHMHSKHESTWKRFGIYQAIMGSTCENQRNKDLIPVLAEMWCRETNTFIFPWGEATITLEDIMVSGGFSVLGSPIFSPLESPELKEIEERLIQARKDFVCSAARSARQYPWLMHFMERKSELEHEAFLSLWLSRFVFPGISKGTITKLVFPIAIHLARGTKLALAPAVLASIYRDLSVLKAKIVALIELESYNEKDNGLAITLSAPFELVRNWAWERFETLWQKPSSRMHTSQMSKLELVRLALDSARESFQWRPYAKVNGSFSKLYSEKEEWIPVDHNLDEEFESFARCLRPSELVGIDSIKQYLPHLVAMQFGMDQDVPGFVIRNNESPEIAWRSYNEPMNDKMLYIFHPDTSRQVLHCDTWEWWKQSKLGEQDAVKGVAQHQISSNDSKRSSKCSTERIIDDNDSIPPYSPPNCKQFEAMNPDQEENLIVKEQLRSCKRDESRMVGDGKPLLVAKSHVPSQSTAYDGKVIKTEPLTEFVKDKQSEPLVGESIGDMEDWNESKEGSPEYNVEGLNGNEGESSRSCTFELPGSSLEARISQLEKVVSKLKEARGGNKFEKNPTNGSHSCTMQLLGLSRQIKLTS